MEKKDLAIEKTVDSVDLNKLLKVIEAIDPNSFKVEGNEDAVDLYFIQKEKAFDSKYEYFSYKPSISKKIQIRIKEIVKNRVLEILELISEKQYTQCQYNPSGQIDGTIEICSKEFVKNLEDLILSMKNENQLEGMIEANDIHTYCFHFKHKDEEVIFLRRFTKMRRLREGFIGIFTDGTFGQIEGEVLGIDNDIDLILYGDIIVVLNHISLERIFDLEQQFRNEAKDTLDMIKSQDIIMNFDEFETDVLNNTPAIKRLTKIKMNQTLPLFFDNFDKVVEVSKTFGLGIVFNNTEDKIIYEDKSQLTEITLLMNDSYYKTLIGDKPGADMLK